ncbi:YqgE/AlgH family protein [Candidatus Poriferisodalis sp.]|uniref:YqgE/AlgH family protein n=1 Tax=Candidatus Poriferisodalis sp. TaxID=3101277 RepID=UPI003B01F498
MVEVVVTPVRVPRAGDLLVATPRLVDPNFDRTVVFVIEHQEAGTLGVVINRDSGISCAAAVPRWAPRFSEGAAVGLGGPVEPQGLLALGTTLAAPSAQEHSASSAGGESSETEGVWRSVSRGVGLVNLTADPSELDAEVVAVRIYGGHAGWGPGQLRGELEAGCWWVFDASAGDLTADATTLWYDVLARQPAPACLLANYPDDPSHN